MTTRSVFDSTLQQIRDDLLRLGSLVDQAIGWATTALVERDAALAQRIIDTDVEINKLRYKIEDNCVQALATQQPMASDLRMLVASLTVAINLERMGDHAEGMAKMLVQEDADAVGNLMVDLPHMADKVRRMLRLAMEALTERDVTKAHEAARMDDDVDAMYKQMFGDLIDHMIGDALPVSRGTYQLWAAHNLERIGDRVTNICERVEFASTGSMHDMNP